MMQILQILVLLNVLLADVAIGWLVYKSQDTNLKEQTISNVQFPVINTQYIDKCGDECKKYIDDKIAEIPEVIIPTTKPAVQTKAVPKTKTRSVSYITISGSGSSNKNDWADIAGTDFYLNTADYPGLVEIYFESNMKLFNGNGMAYVRLYDITHGIGVQGSDVQTTSQISTLITSGKVSFWAGKNQIRVQAKSLTADTAVFDSGRLRIVTEN